MGNLFPVNNIQYTKDFPSVVSYTHLDVYKRQGIAGFRMLIRIQPEHEFSLTAFLKLHLRRRAEPMNRHGIALSMQRISSLCQPGYIGKQIRRLLFPIARIPLPEIFMSAAAEDVYKRQVKNAAVHNAPEDSA